MNNVYKDLTITYLDYAVKKLNHLDIYDLSELFRVSLCECLQLQTRCNCKYDIIPYNIELKKLLLPIINSNRLLDTSIEYRQGILEACVHNIEITSKKAGIKKV